MKKILLLVGLLLVADLALAYDFHIRAREHWDQVTIKYGETGDETHHQGIGPMFDFWMEKPYHHSVGFAYGLTYIKNDGATPYGQGTKDFEMITTGLEGKHYLWSGEGGPFGRWAYSRHSLKAKNAFEDMAGTGSYLGLGWEVNTGRIGLAFEAGKLQADFDREIRIEAVVPSLGVHFYGYI